MSTHSSTVAVVQSVALTGFDGEPIEVEADIKAGLPSLQIVGIGSKAIDEARQRVRSAITNSLLDFPKRKVIVNLAPAELPKDGTHLDLPIALCILAASGQVKANSLKGAIFAGELALDGTLRPIRGAVVIAQAAKQSGARYLFLPYQSAPQAQLVAGIEVIGVQTLQALFQHLRGIQVLPPLTHLKPLAHSSIPQSKFPVIDAIIGQEQAKRAIMIAAAGRHNVLFTGPPGTGKTLLAKTLVGLLPPLVDSEITEVTKLHSLANDTSGHVYTAPPFRAPHHSVTLTALIGGGLRPKPGDISLAHKGVLFLDELPEYPRATLEALRQPLEDRIVSLSRLYGRITYPADILLVATANPCPCGFLGDQTTNCRCSMAQIEAYKKRISGPLLDRIDLRLSVPKISNEHLLDSKSLTQSQHFKVLKLVLSAREAQKERYKRSNFYNAYASIEQAKSLFNVTPTARKVLKTASDTLGLSSRAYLRVLRVARTIADLESSTTLTEKHIAEALQFRE